MNEDKHIQELVAETVAGILRRYRADQKKVEKNVREAFAADQKLQKIFERESAAGKIRRTRVFRDAVARIKRNIYYELRRYSIDEEDQTDLIERLAELSGNDSPTKIRELADEIIGSHISTRERLKDQAEFYEQIFEFIGSPATVLDVGSGVQPLLFPFERLGDKLERYLAAEKNANAVAAVNAYARAARINSLTGVRWDIADGWEALGRHDDSKDFDVAFLFKLIPVVKRQRPELVDILQKTPARLWVMTGSKISLTKKRSIERRERHVLQQFIESTGRRVVGEISTENEFGFVVRE